MKKFLCCTGLVIGTAVVSNAAALVSIDFEDTQSAGNFRVLNANGATLGLTANGAANDFYRSQNGSGAAVVYDANGSAAGVSTFTVSQAQSITVSADVSFNTASNSFGVYIINAADETQGYLALFNVNNGGGSNDFIRFASDAAPKTSGAGTLGAGSYLNNADLGVGVGGVFGSISVTYSINGSNKPVLTMTAGNQTSSIALTSITTPFTTVEIGFRLGSGSGTIGMDNLVISESSAIPEPSSFAALAGIAVLGLCGVRRRLVR